MKKTIRTMIAIEVLLTAVTSFTTPLHADEKPAEESIVRVMSYNVFHGARRRGQPLSQTAKVIQEGQADMVGLQELQVGKYPKNTEELAKLLGWNHDTSSEIVTRYEIVERLKGDNRDNKGGIKVKLPSGREAYIFNLHLPSGPYQPYQLLGITRGGEKITTETEAIDWARMTRGRLITRLLRQIRKLPDQEAPVFVVGDFNEPSHLDWTEAAAKSGRHPIKVAYPTSLAMTQAGFTDAWRTIYPDEMKNPGYTWSPMYKPDGPRPTHYDRIDFVYFKGKGVNVTEAKIIGENKENADIVVAPYPSDHRAVVATFTLPHQPKSDDPAK